MIFIADFYKTLSFLLILFVVNSCTVGQNNSQTKGKTNMKFNKLSEQEKYVILNKGTEAPFTGKYNEFSDSGTYICRQCNAELYRSADKFDGHCGWPSFDDEISGAVKHIPDADGRRTEIVCANCGGHLGHVFLGESYTTKNTRHCVNSVSIDFKPAQIKNDTITKAYFAGGCFWGMEYYFQKAPGVIEVVSGYMGGKNDNPTYEQVCSGTSGHFETIEVTYNSSETNFTTLAKLFFEIHNPEQANGQGPDIGSQYLSVAFYTDQDEKKQIEALISELSADGFKIATKVMKVSKFWKAENYHQDYYDNNGHKPYCHGYTKRFK